MKNIERPGRRARLTRAAAAASLLLALALAAGCSGVPQRDVLARVGDRTLTADDFRAVAKDNAAQYPFEPESAKSAMLDDMVRRELLLAEGRRLGYDRDTSVVRPDPAADAEILSRALLERMVPKDMAVSDAEVAQLHAWRASKAHVFLIYTPSRAAADRAMTELRAGKPFAEVSASTSLPGVVPPGGDIGWVVSGQLIDPIDQTAREAKVGEPQGPLPAPTEGWFIVLVTERQSQPLAPLDTEKPFLTDMLRQRKQRTATIQAAQDLRKQYRVQVEPRAAQLIFEIGNAAPGQEPPFDRAQVVARYDGGPTARGTYTMGDAVADLSNPLRERAPFSSTSALEHWIDSQVIQRVAVIEAKRRGLDQEADVKRRLRARTDNAILQRVYEERVAKGVEATEAEVRALYEQRVAQFAASPEMAHGQVPPAFEALPEQLRASLEQQAVAQKRDARLGEVTEQLRASIKPFEVHKERLAPLPWPAPAMPPGMMGMPGMPQGHP